MKNWEALKALVEKKCVRHESWMHGAYISVDLHLEPRLGQWAHTAEWCLARILDGWEIYDPRTEDDVDRRVIALLYHGTSRQQFTGIREQLIMEFGKPLVERAEARACSR
jgi:hypothetical protein